MLADGQKGDMNYRSGKWIGSRKPLEVLLRLDTARTISSVMVSTVIDINGYIMPPKQVQVWAGADPAKLRLVKSIVPEQPVKDSSGYMHGFELAFAPVSGKYFKVVVVPVPILPLWHRGKGDRGWVFVDEIFLN